MKTLYCSTAVGRHTGRKRSWEGPFPRPSGRKRRKTPQAAPAKTATPIVPVALGSAKHNYTRGPQVFPNLLAPYSPISIAAPGLTKFAPNRPAHP